MVLPSAWPSERVFAGGGPPIAASLHPLPSGLHAHSHDFLEVALVCGGRGVQRSARGEHGIAGGDLIVLRPGAWHAYERCERLMVYDCCIGRELIAGAAPLIAREPALAALGRRDAVARISDDAVGECRARLDDLRRGLDAGARPLALIGRLLLALDAIARALPDVDDGAPPLVAAALRLMDEALDAPWTLAGLARRLRIDRSYLARRFRAATGLPPMAWLARRRGERAAELLTATDWPIARVATAVGWPDAAHFAHRFRRAHGFAASEWRRRRPVITG
ncbi:MAG TPA: AraC family transcriptional regulator [Planctomycetota bacterium]|nr:AraC family transcriptional regulator [Planctomycetota bacterium]